MCDGAVPVVPPALVVNDGCHVWRMGRLLRELADPQSMRIDLTMITTMSL
jgi:hypothetical protein